MHLAPLIIDLAMILIVAGTMAVISQKLRQPVVLGYILAGVVLGPHTPPFSLVNDTVTIQTFAELGVIFLMFTLGLEFSFKKLLSTGVTPVVAAVLEVTFFLIIGYGIGRWLLWSPMDSLYLGAMLSISSTTIIIKALEELKLKSRRFATLIFGILIVEDLLAILLLVGLTTISSTGSFSFMALASAGLNLVLVVGSWFIVGHFIVPRLVSFVARKGSNEMLTLVSLGLCLSLVVVAHHFGYSPALGAFIMGSILAETKIIHQIEGLMAPLRDLFGAIFFVSIGMLIDPMVIWEYGGIIALLCLVTIFGKILIISFGSLISGQNIKNSLQIGFGLAQIGEFSFIIAGLGMELNATSNKIYPIAVAVSLVTTFTTPYLIKYSGRFAEKIEKVVPVRTRKLVDRYVAWCESVFMWKLAKQGVEDSSLTLSSLVPWDFHMVNVSIHPNAKVVNQSLVQANLRHRFGINVVAIQRGVRTIVAPRADEIIFPGDTLVVLGSDDQIDLARPELEVPENIAMMFPMNPNYRLRHLKVSPDSGLVGVSILQSGIREKYHAMVVGVERSSERIINPNTDLIIQADDVVWTVGEGGLLDELFEAYG